MPACAFFWSRSLDGRLFRIVAAGKCARSNWAADSTASSDGVFATFPHLPSPRTVSEQIRR